MLRYLLCFAIVINLELVFCYKYTGGVRSDPARPRRAARVPKRQASFLETPLQQIDVASFILTPDEVEDYNRPEPDELYTHKSYAPAGGARRARRRQAPYPAPDGLSSHQRQQLKRRHLLHNPNKKSVLAKIFPFFSHNKSDTAQAEGAKKTGVGTFSKKAADAVPSTETTVDRHKEQKSPRYSMDELRVEKRFAGTRPKCRLKFTKLKGRRKLPEVTHNSRQYFANHPVKGVERSSKQHKNVDFRERSVGNKPENRI